MAGTVIRLAMFEGCFPQRFFISVEMRLYKQITTNAKVL